MLSYCSLFSFFLFFFIEESDAFEEISESSSDVVEYDVITTSESWAQCERCQKWRRVPKEIDPESLPDPWFCELNYWDPLHDDCSKDEDLEHLEHEVLWPK